MIASIQPLLQRRVAENAERGIQVAAYLHGRLVVDAWAGAGIDGDTLFPVFSVTKGIASTVIHRLVERGAFTYDTPLAERWPAFAAHGKGGITVRHALAHTAGLPFMPPGIGHAELYEWDAMCAALAALPPAFPPGAQSYYHAMTFGWLLGEFAACATARSFPQLLRDEITAPLGVTESLFVGLPDAAQARVAELEEIGWQPPAETDPTRATVPAWLQPMSAWMNRPDSRRACIPASNGIMNARAIARHYAALLPGGVDGVELLPPARLALAIEQQTPAGQHASEPAARGLGYQLFPGMFSAGSAAFGHAGWGGSTGFADPASGLAFGLTRSRLGNDDTRQQVLDAIKVAFK